MAVLIYAHPYPNRSRANRSLLAAVKDVPGLDVRSLYDLYPDFAIDVGAEQRALSASNLIIWQHPMYWYSVPSLLKHWFDKVLARGWAYGKERALAGKRCLWVTTTGGDEHAFHPEGMHRRPWASFAPPIEQTACFCGMEWLPPIVLHGAHTISASELEARAVAYREAVDALVHVEGGVE